MRIIFFTREYTTHDRRFLEALSNTEHKVYFLRLERHGYQSEDRPVPPNVEVVPWTGGRGTVTFKDFPKLLPELKRIIRSIKPDIIQAGPIQRSALLVALTHFQPLVSMSWGYDLIIDANRNPFWRWATRYTLKHSAVMVGDCNTIRELAVSYGMPNERIVTFPWGINLDLFTPPATPKDANTDFTLLSTRGWEPIYGTDILAKAFGIAAKKRPDIRLIMLGNGSQAGILRNIFSRYGVGEKVLRPGQMNQDELPYFYHNSDIYIAASHSDGTSISLLEAMASGLPVIVSDIPGNREWVTPGVQGWLSPDGDIDALAQAIVHAYDHRNTLPEMGVAARKLAEQRADWDKNFPNLLKAYDLAIRVAKKN